MTALLGRASIGFVPTGCCATHRVLRDGLRACRFGVYFHHCALFLSAKRKILPHRR